MPIAIAKPWHVDEFWAALAAALGPGDADHACVTGAPAVAAEYALALNILVVEDDPVNAELVATLIGRLGYTVTVARDGPDALVRLGDADFHLVLVDQRMPGMDGLEFARRVRARETPENRLPLVTLTANAAIEMRERGLEAGMDGFLSKLLDAGALDALIDRLVRA